MISRTIGEWKEYLDLEKAECPRCGSSDLERKDKHTIRCNKCTENGRFWFDILDWVLAQHQYDKEKRNTEQIKLSEVKA